MNPFKINIFKTVVSEEIILSKWIGIEPFCQTIDDDTLPFKWIGIEPECVTTDVRPLRVIQIENLNSVESSIEITSVQIGGFEVNLESTESFPIAGEKMVMGSYNPVGTSDQQIISVFSNNLSDLPVRLNVITSNPIPQCQLSNGFTEYMNVNLTTNPRINITLDVQGTSCF